MKPILIFRHIECEGPGYFEQVLNRYQLPFSIIRIDQQDPIPQNIDHASALVFMGGPMSVNDDIDWVDQECQLIERAVNSNMPVLGHCLGGQLISKALGGQITQNPVKEIGWFPVSTAGNAQSRHYFDGIKNFIAFHWHGETFSIPKNAETILKSDHCPHQAFTLGNTLALQCHIEMTEDMVNEWANLYQYELIHPSDTIQSKTEMTEGLKLRIGELQKVADQVYQKWLEPIISLKE